MVTMAYAVFIIRVFLIMILDPSNPIFNFLADEQTFIGYIGKYIHYSQLSFVFFFIFIRITIFRREKTNKLGILGDFRYFLQENLATRSGEIKCQDELYLNSENRQKILQRAFLVSKYFEHFHTILYSGVIILFSGFFYLSFGSMDLSLFQHVAVASWYAIIIASGKYIMFDYAFILPTFYLSVYYNKLCADQFNQRLNELKLNITSDDRTGLLKISFIQTYHDFHQILNRLNLHNSTSRIVLLLFEYFYTPLTPVWLLVSSRSDGLISYILIWFGAVNLVTSFIVILQVSSIFKEYQSMHRHLNQVYCCGHRYMDHTIKFKWSQMIKVAGSVSCPIGWHCYNLFVYKPSMTLKVSLECQLMNVKLQDFITVLRDHDENASPVLQADR